MSVGPSASMLSSVLLPVCFLGAKILDLGAESGSYSTVEQDSCQASPSAPGGFWGWVCSAVTPVGTEPGRSELQRQGDAPGQMGNVISLYRFTLRHSEKHPSGGVRQCCEVRRWSERAPGAGRMVEMLPHPPGARMGDHHSWQWGLPGAHSLGMGLSMTFGLQKAQQGKGVVSDCRLGNGKTDGNRLATARRSDSHVF